MESIKIQKYSSSVSENLIDIEHITNIVNRVYTASEGDLWKRGAVRTTVAEMAEFIKKGEIAVALSNDEIVGCVRVRQVDQETGEFGMLAVDDEYQGNGVGQALIAFVEERFEKEGICRVQLELLVPRERLHPEKVILDRWYRHLGYDPVGTRTVEESLPGVAQLLAMPCGFVVFRKELC